MPFIINYYICNEKKIILKLINTKLNKELWQH